MIQKQQTKQNEVPKGRLTYRQQAFIQIQKQKHNPPSKLSANNLKQLPPTKFIIKIRSNKQIKSLITNPS